MIGIFTVSAFGIQLSWMHFLPQVYPTRSAKPCYTSRDSESVERHLAVGNVKSSFPRVRGCSSGLVVGLTLQPSPRGWPSSSRVPGVCAGPPRTASAALSKTLSFAELSCIPLRNCEALDIWRMETKIEVRGVLGHQFCT